MKRKEKILIGLLTGHNTLNQHLTLLKIKEDPMCPLCGEEYDTSLHLLGRCEMKKTCWKTIKHLLVPSELRQEHRSSLLKSVKNSKKFQ